MFKNSRIYLFQGNGDGSATALEDLTTSWMTGIPTTVLFLGKSFLNVPKGPGGIVITSPTQSPNLQTRRKSEAVDFTGTTNM